MMLNQKKKTLVVLSAIGLLLLLVIWGNEDRTVENGHSLSKTNTLIPSVRRIFMNTTTWTRVQTERRKNVADMCQNIKAFNISQVAKELRHQLFIKSVLVDENNNVLYCAVPKVACTSWKVAMAKLSGKPEAFNETKVRNIHDRKVLRFFGLKGLGEYDKSTRNTLLKTSTKFMTVRHPLERLLSAWRDKFATHNEYTHYFQMKYERTIIAKSRADPSEVSVQTGHDVTFIEFIRYILDPNFSAKFRLNPHWTPFSILCDPCQTRYDYIVRYETMTDDTPMLLERVYGVRNTTSFLPRRTARGIPTKNVISEFYKDVDKDMLRDLLEFYRDDFLLFGYSHELDF